MADVPAAAAVNPTPKRAILALYTIFVVGVSLWPSPTLPFPMPDHGDLAIHFILYLFWTILLLWQSMPLMWVLFLVAIVGTLLEVAQIAVPGRTFSWLDILADSSGAVVAALGARAWRASSS